MKGLRTLEDVEANGNLTPSQKIGLKYYKEIQETIPRQEVEEIMQLVILRYINVQILEIKNYLTNTKFTN